MLDIWVLDSLHWFSLIDDLGLGQVSLRQVFCSDNLLKFLVLQECEFLGSADPAAQREAAALSRISRRGWMRDTERTIDAIAVFERRFEIAPIPLVIVAVDAHVVRSKAVVSGLSAAEHALPINLLTPVLLACRLASADVLEQTGLA